MLEFFQPYFAFDIDQKFLDLNAIVYISLVLIIFYVAKKVYEVILPYDLNKELMDNDNKAVAVSFAGYMFAVGIILLGILNDSEQRVILTRKDLQYDLLNTFVWCIIGIVLLHLSRIINDKIILSRFCNIKEIITDKNVATGAVQSGTFIGSGFIISASLSGGEEYLLYSIILMMLFFVISQLGFILYAYIYQFITNYDIHDEIEKENVAAGVAFGLNLIAVSLIIYGYVISYDSLIGLVLWYVVSVVALLLVRNLTNRVVLAGFHLDTEIKEDNNWGVALVEGSIAIIFALILNAAF